MICCSSLGDINTFSEDNTGLNGSIDFPLGMSDTFDEWDDISERDIGWWIPAGVYSSFECTLIGVILFVVDIISGVTVFAGGRALADCFFLIETRSESDDIFFCFSSAFSV